MPFLRFVLLLSYYLVAAHTSQYSTGTTISFLNHNFVARRILFLKMLSTVHRYIKLAPLSNNVIILVICLAAKRYDKFV